jgi:hypothetical protein
MTILLIGRTLVTLWHAQGLYVDTPVVLVSGFLLILMFAIAFQRILGLDKFVAELMM